MIKNILVAVDLSGGAEQVMASAIEIAGKYQAAIHVMTAIEQPVMPMGEFVDPIPVIDMIELRKYTLIELKKRAETAGIQADKVSVEIGRPVDMILEQAAKRACDLIVIGSHGRHGLQLLLGSTANAVLHHAKCDVLAVRIR